MAALSSSVGHLSRLQEIISTLKDLSTEREKLTHLAHLGSAVEKARQLALDIPRIHQCDSCRSFQSIFHVIQSPIIEHSKDALKEKATLIDSIVILFQRLHSSTVETSVVPISSSTKPIEALVPKWNLRLTSPELDLETLEVAQRMSNDTAKDLSSLSVPQIKKLVDGLLQLSEKGQAIDHQIRENISAFNVQQTIVNEGIQKKWMNLETQVNDLRRRRAQELILSGDEWSRQRVSFSVKWVEILIPDGEESVTISSKDPKFDSTIRAWGHEFWIDAKKCRDGRVILSLCVDRNATVKPFNLRYQFLFQRRGQDKLAYETAVFTEEFGKMIRRENPDFLNLDMLEAYGAYDPKEGVLTFACQIDFSPELKWGITHYEEDAQTPSLMPSTSSTSSISSTASSSLLPSWTEVFPLPKIQAEVLEMARNASTMALSNIEILAQAAIQAHEGWQLFNEHYAKCVADFNDRQTMTAQKIEQQFALFGSSIEKISEDFKVRIQKLKNLHSCIFLQFVIPVWSTIIVHEGVEYVSLYSYQKTPATEAGGRLFWLEVRKFREGRVDLLLCTDSRAETRPFNAKYQLMAYHGAKKKPVCQSELLSTTFGSGNLACRVTFNEKQLIEEGALMNNVITFGAIIPFTSLHWGPDHEKSLSSPVKV